MSERIETISTEPPPRRGYPWLRLRRILRRVGIAVAAVLLVLCAATAAVIWRVLPPQQDVLTLPGVSAPIGVSFDDNDIPFIRAASMTDAAAALGYVHARDRLFQMDLMRRAAGGTLAQLFGAAALPNDEEMRRLGIRRSAEADATDLSPQARAVLQAYASGVNAWIARRGRYAAPEFVFLGRPRPWTVTDSLLWGKMMGLWLSGNWRAEMQRLALSGRFTKAQIDSLWPPVPGMKPEEASLPRALLPRLAAAATRTLLGIRYFPQPFTLPAQASNEWAVAGFRTASGRPLLAGDPHLSFGFPSLWYLARIDTPEGLLAGATAPGLPFMVIGQNGHVGWTFTTTGATVQDIFIEHPTADGREYQTPEGPEPFQMRQELIPVRGQKPHLLTIAETRHGPVMGQTADGRGLLAVQMGNLAPHDTDADGLLALNQAQNVMQVGAAAALITSPVQNLLTADIANHIAFFTTGRVPLRKAGDGRWPVDGADGQHDWTGFARGLALPHAIDPPSGELVNANEPTAGPDFPVEMGRDAHGDWRARRIRTLLAATDRHTVESFGYMQMDVTSDLAQQLLPRLRQVTLPAGDAAAPALTLLAGWDGSMKMDKPQPLIFNAWTRAFLERVLVRRGLTEATAPIETGNFLLSLIGPHASATARAMWCGDDCTGLLRKSLQAAMGPLRIAWGANAARWQWGRAHHALFAHPVLSRLPLIGALSRIAIKAPGDDSTIDLAAPAGTPADPDGFTAVHGPELRVIYDLADLDRSHFIIAPGQSGNPLDSHRRDLLRPWRDGGAVTLGPEPNDVSRQIRIMP